MRGVVEHILEAIGVRAKIEIVEDDERLTATVVGRELGLVIGKHGQTIDAIQYLANAVVWRGRGDERKAVVVDAAGYRAAARRHWRRSPTAAPSVRSRRRARSSSSR